MGPSPLRIATLSTVALLSGIQPAAGGAAAPAEPAEVRRLAERFPALDPSEANCPPFVARGSMPEPESSYEYEYVFLGKEFRCTLFDPADAMPLAIATRKAFVVYDLPGGSLFVFPGGRLDLSVLPSGDGVGGLSTAIRGATDSSGSAPDATRWDIRHAILEAAERSTIERLDDGTVRLTQQLDDDRTRIVDFAPPPSRNVNFGQFSRTAGRYTSYHELRIDGIDPNDPALRSPDLQKAGFKKLDGDVHMMVAMVQVMSRMDAYAMIGAIRRGGRGDEVAREKCRRFNLDWDEVKERDDELREPWLKLLRGLDVTLTPPPERPWDEKPRGEPLVRRATPTTTPAS